MITIKNGLIALLAVFTLSGCMSSSPNPENSFATNSQATLENGLTYAIHAKQDNSQKIQLRLFIKSGSLSETEDQQGYAHLLEHMAFNGTKNFPKNKIIELFEKSGLTFGQDINAYTSFTETVYTLSVPASDKKLLDETLLYLRDVLNDIEFDQAELDKEKGVVQNEYRLSVPQEPPYYYAFFSDYIEGSDYEKHLPIGTLDSIGNSTEQSVKAFYKQWYRPNNAKLLITGDVDTELAKKLISDTFSSIEPSTNQQVQVVPNAPDLSPKSKAFSSQVVTSPQTDLFFEVPYATINNSEQLSQNIKQNMLGNMLNYRLNILNSEREQPFSQAYFGYFEILNNKAFKHIAINYEKENPEKTTTFIAQELARLEQHGFSQAEYNLQLEALKSQQAELRNNYLNQNSAQIANNVVKSWSQESAMFTFELEQQAFQTALATLNLDEINRLARQLIKSPKKLTFAYPSNTTQPEVLRLEENFAKDLNKAIANSDIKIEKIVLPVITINSDISPITSEKFYAQKNITQLTLSNGVSVVLQPDTSVKNSINMSFSAPGGINILDGKTIAANTLLVNSYMNSGLAGLSPQTLNQQFINANASINPAFYNSNHGFTMQSVNKSSSLKLLFSLIYSVINDATIKPEVFAQEKKKLIDQQENFLAQPTSESMSKVFEALYPGSPYQHVFTINELQAIQQSDVETLHAHFFGSVNGYKLTIVGDFDIDEMQTLVLQYIATLKGGKLHQFNERPMALIEKATKLNAETNPQDNALVSLIAVTDNKNQSIKEVYQGDLMRRILTQTLTQVVREKLSLTYSPIVSVSDQPEGNHNTEVFIQMVTKVEDAQKTQQVVSDIVNNFITNGISEEQLADHQLGLTKGMLSNLHKSTDRQWLLHRDHLQGYELDSTENAKAIVDSITLEDMNQFFKTYLDPNKTLQIINIPEK